MTRAAVQREACDAGRGDDACRNGETEELRLPVQIAKRGAALYAHRLCRRIDVHAPHPGEVDHQTAVVDRIPGDVVAASLDRQQQIVLTREVHGVDDIRGAGALHDQRGPAIDQAVPDRARLVVAFVARGEHAPSNRCRQRLNRFGIQRHGRNRLN